MSEAAALQTQRTMAPSGNSYSLLVQRKCACGGSAGLTGSCTECERKKLLGQPLQTKLRISEPGDEYEQEADRVAEQVMRMAPPKKENDHSEAATVALVQRRLSGASAGVAVAPPIVDEVLSSPGQPLDVTTRAFFEPRFGHDFSHVRVHVDSRAAESARSVNARAYTLGHNVVFGSSEYNLGTSHRQRLLAHELTHVVQQQRTWASTTHFPHAYRWHPGRGYYSSPLIIQRTEGTSEPESAAKDTPNFPPWIITEQLGVTCTTIDPETGKQTKEVIPPGTSVTPSEPRVTKVVSNKTITQVEWSGREVWVLDEHLVKFDPTYATPRGEEPYRQTVKSFPADRQLTAKQQELLDRARNFTDDGSIPTPPRMDTLPGIDQDLLSRLKKYYRFLKKEDLITDQDFSMSGSRAPQTAHELSTKWMLYSNFLRNDKAKFNSEMTFDWIPPEGLIPTKIRFAEKLVEINGTDSETGMEWADGDIVKILAADLRKLSRAWVDWPLSERILELLSGGESSGGKVDEDLLKLVDIDGLLSEKKLYRPTEDQNYKKNLINEARHYSSVHNFFIQLRERAWREIEGRTQEIGDTVESIRANFSRENEYGKPQTYLALEGYPKSSPKRYPNIMDVEQTQHLAGDAADIHFPFKFYYFDPIIDDIATVFGLKRAALAGARGEYWHYQAVGQPLRGTQQSGDQTGQ